MAENLDAGSADGRRGSQTHACSGPACLVSLEVVHKSNIYVFDGIDVRTKADYSVTEHYAVLN